MTDRLSLIAPYLRQYTRRFHVLDIGGGIEPRQNVGQQIARNFDAVCTVFEQDWTPRNFEPSPRTMVLRHSVTPEDLSTLAACEHFGVVLLLNVLHWYGEDWRSVLDTSLRMANYVVVQIPGREDLGNPGLPGREFVPEMLEWLRPFEPLGHTVQFPGHAPRPLWILEGATPERRLLTQTHADGMPGDAETTVYSPTDKLWAEMRKKRQERTWIPGVNLHNFCKFGGAYPTASMIDEQLSRISVKSGVRTDGHGDIALHNIVMDGSECYLIDGHEGWESDDAAEMTKVRAKVKELMARSEQ